MNLAHGVHDDYEDANHGDDDDLEGRTLDAMCKDAKCLYVFHRSSDHPAGDVEIVGGLRVAWPGVLCALLALPSTSYRPGVLCALWGFWTEK